MAKIRLEEGDCGTYLVSAIATNAEIRAGGYKNRKEFEAEHSTLIQTDWDYPGTASTFGWSPCKDCEHSCEGSTDGTVDCAGKTASQMISEARDYLDDHIGDEVEDPGYFG